MSHPPVVRLFVAGLLLGGAASILSGQTTGTPTPQAQSQEGGTPGVSSVTLADPARWLTADPPDYGHGAVLAVAGLVGALITTFFLVGGAVPGTAGQAKIDAETQQLEALARRLHELIASTPIEPSAVEAVERTVNNLRDDLRAETWRQFLIASCLYAVLGAAIAALLGDDLLTALVIGAGWTGFLGSLGLKRDYAERKAIKDSAIEDALSVVKKADAWNQPERRASALTPDRLDALATELGAAKAL
jgi:hypothetical protein